jgi:hypothetical protein
MPYPTVLDTKNIIKSNTKSLYSLLWTVFGEWELGIAKPPVMFCGLNISLIMLIFYMDINIRRNVGVLFYILASEHPVNLIVLVAVMSLSFKFTNQFFCLTHILKLYKQDILMEATGIVIVIFCLCWEIMDEMYSAVKEFRFRWERFFTYLQVFEQSCQWARLQSCIFWVLAACSEVGKDLHVVMTQMITALSPPL